MTRKDIIAKIAEAKYLQRMRIKHEFDLGGGDAETDWRWAERAVEWLESERENTIQDEYKREEFGWIGSLYYQLTGGQDVKRG